MSNAKKALNRNARNARSQGKRGDHGPLLKLVIEDERRRPRTPTRPRETRVEPLNDAQRQFDALMVANTLTFALGPAGTGKTWFAAARMAERLRDREIERIIITRPAVEAGESLGFLPGELDEKYEPYFRPVREALVEVLGAGAVECHIKNGTIEARPLALLRGSTFKHADVLLDEAQNTTPGQMKMFLTRIGEGCRVVVNGDAAQKDIPGPSGLLDAVDRLRKKQVRSVGVMRFTRADVVRSGFCQDVLEAYENDEDPSVARYDESNDNAISDDGLKRFIKA
ncbi:PhoH family protein [Methylorubrum extorquens]|uniref:PhoH family protein n=1 Tax=Methylorubrum extorquens TaxID=408 RepID=UPI00209E08A7|nr:phosphate starvation-inducible PhoH-like protein [Methylorubrum extorquens]